MELKLRELILGFVSMFSVLGILIWGMYKFTLLLSNSGRGLFPCLMVWVIVIGTLIGILTYLLQK